MLQGCNSLGLDTDFNSGNNIGVVHENSFVLFRTPRITGITGILHIQKIRWKGPKRIIDFILCQFRFPFSADRFFLPTTKVRTRS